MATRGLVGAIDHESGEVYAIHVAYDAYPEGLGRTLLNHYRSDSKVVDLISMGGARGIGSTIEKSDFYHRDHKAPLEREHYLNKKSFFDRIEDAFVEYIYLWDDGRWHYAGYRYKSFKPLTKQAIK